MYVLIINMDGDLYYYTDKEILNITKDFKKAKRYIYSESAVEDGRTFFGHPMYAVMQTNESNHLDTDDYQKTLIYYLDTILKENGVYLTFFDLSKLIYLIWEYGIKEYNYSMIKRMRISKVGPKPMFDCYGINLTYLETKNDLLKNINDKDMKIIHEYLKNMELKSHFELSEKLEQSTYSKCTFKAIKENTYITTELIKKFMSITHHL